MRQLHVGGYDLLNVNVEPKFRQIREMAVL